MKPTSFVFGDDLAVIIVLLL